MRQLRLLPLLVACAGALLVLKLSGLALMGRYALPLPVVAPAQAQQAPAAAPSGTAADPAAPAMADPAGEGSGSDVQGRIVKPGEDVNGAKAAVLERLGERRQQLDAREKELDMREALINAAQARIEDRVAELKEIEARITMLVEKKEAEKKAQLKGLVTMYETMKPKDAARIFSELDLSVLVDVVEQMNARKMAEVLANMEVKAAERLTLAIANKSREAAVPAPQPELPKIEGKPQG